MNQYIFPLQLTTFLELESIPDNIMKEFENHVQKSLQSRSDKMLPEFFCTKMAKSFVCLMKIVCPKLFVVSNFGKFYLNSTAQKFWIKFMKSKTIDAFSPPDLNQDCLICFSISKSQIFMCWFCKKLFCQKCISKWTKQTCPHCRENSNYIDVEKYKLAYDDFYFFYNLIKFF